MRYELQPLPPDNAAHWDELVAQYESRQLFHHTAWLDYLAASRGAEIRKWAIRDGEHTVGYFCGGVVHKGPFRVLGSPLRGWGTNFMGPLVNPDFDQTAFLQALEDLAADERFDMVEIENPILSARLLAASGYEPIPQPTYIVELTPGEPEKMWNRLSQPGRTKVRKALKSGLAVEETADPAVADQFYDRFRRVMVRQGLYPPYSRACPRLLFQCLKPKDMLLALRVRGPLGEVIAIGLFPHDETTLYFWGGASDAEAAKYAPNDLLHWTAMEMAAAQGVRRYNMCGFGFFKKKFGGVLEEPMRWHKCYGPTARWGRYGYERYSRWRARLQGRWHQLVGQRLTR